MSNENRFAFLNKRLAVLLDSDPEGATRLAALDGRSLVLVNADLAFGLWLTVADGKLEVRPTGDEPADSTAPRVIGGLAALRRLVLGREMSVAALIDSCEVDGDAEEARLWFEILAKLRPDFAKPFAGLLADEQLEGFVHGARRRLREFASLLTKRPPGSGRDD